MCKLSVHAPSKQSLFVRHGELKKVVGFITGNGHLRKHMQRLDTFLKRKELSNRSSIWKQLENQSGKRVSLRKCHPSYLKRFSKVEHFVLLNNNCIN